MDIGGADRGPVECLGLEFETETARREHFTELLREKLADPDAEFRQISGFPSGSDEDILAMSDLPHHTGTSSAKRLKEFRTEVVRAGTKDTYDRGDYGSIVAVAHKLPDSVLQEDEKLLMYYDVAQRRSGELRELS